GLRKAHRHVAVFEADDVGHQRIDRCLLGPMARISSPGKLGYSGASIGAKCRIAERAGPGNVAASPCMKEGWMSGLSRRRLLQSGSLALGLGTIGVAPPARAEEQITYLFPAPPILPAFGPIRLAQGKGYFRDAGLAVNFATGRGGVDVAKQVG